MLRALGILLLVVIFCLAAALGYFNLTQVQFDYLLGTAQLHLVVLVLIAFAFGVIIAVLLSAYRMLRQRGEIRRLKRRLRTTEAELHKLQVVPGESA